MAAAENPVTKAEVDALIGKDPELAWSTTDYVEMGDETGSQTKYPVIDWNGAPCFWWYRDQIICSGPDDHQVVKLVQMAAALEAYAMGDDGERYELRKPPSGKEEVVTVNDDA